jgi:hypothetical protein
MTKFLPIDPETPVRKAVGHLAIEVDGNVMLMSESQGRYLGLDDIASDIWNRLQKPQTVRELCSSLAGDYAAEPAMIERDVTKLLVTLHGYGLVE